MYVTSTLLAIAWGALAFGGVYVWAFVPLFAACAILGVIGLFRPPAAAVNSRVTIALGLLVTAIALQLVPLPAQVLQAVSPETDYFLRQYLLGYPDSAARHSLSIQPQKTALALAALVSLSVFGCGLARGLTYPETKRLIQGVSLIGVLISIVGVVQKAMWNGKIYGFWAPIQDGNPFGPFVNRNHYAGWILMALPLTAAYFCGSVSRGMRHVRPTWRDRMLWFSTTHAAETVWVAFAVIPMSIGMLMSLSRSGIIGLAAALTVVGAIGLLRLSWSRLLPAAAYMLVAALLVFATVDYERIAGRFSQGGEISLASRIAAWSDAWSVAQRFPVGGTGVNTYGTAMLVYQTAAPDLHYSAAHNDYLHLLAEGGVLVIVPALIVIAFLVAMARRRFVDPPFGVVDAWIRIGAVTGVFAIAFQEMLDFSLQIPGNAVLFVVVIVLLIRRPLASMAHRKVAVHA